MGAFYAPAAAWLDPSFIATLDERNVVNGMGEIVKLALVRSAELFALLEEHGARLIDSRFQCGEVADRVIALSVEIMLEELGPNLWETNLERCVDYGHTFSKVLEMKRLGDLWHGEAVNIDGLLCVLLSEARGWLTVEQRERILHVMRDVCRLPVHDALCDSADTLWQGVLDGIEHRNGRQRVPLLRGAIGQTTTDDAPAEVEDEGAADDAEQRSGAGSDVEGVRGRSGSRLGWWGGRWCVRDEAALRWTDGVEKAGTKNIARETLWSVRGAREGKNRNRARWRATSQLADLWLQEVCSVSYERRL
eukprot:ctg_314.g116